MKLRENSKIKREQEMNKVIIYILIALVLSSCSKDDSLFGGYNDPRYFENIGLNKDPLAQNVAQNIKDIEIEKLFLENDLVKIFILGYYRCPQMCNSFREALFPELSTSKLTLGKDYEILMISINPSETEVEAKENRDKYFSLFFEDDSKREYLNFATAKFESVRAITEKLGFQYRYDKETGEYYHPTIAYVLLPDGTVSNVIDFGERNKTIENKIGLANRGDVFKSDESKPQYLTCMAKDIENKNPNNAFMLAQFGGTWFVSCSIFCFGYTFLSRRERKKEK